MVMLCGLFTWVGLEVKDFQMFYLVHSTLMKIGVIEVVMSYVS